MSNENESKDEASGYIAAFVAILLFGSSFVPVKRYETGDGMFFQLMMCLGIWCIGLGVNIVELSHHAVTFHPLAMLGGFFWTTGNICSVPIVRLIGLSLGMLLWGSTNLIFGWASGRFGLFNTRATAPRHALLNDLGVVFCVLSLPLFIMVKSQVKPPTSSKRINDDGCTINETTGLLTGAAGHDVSVNSNNNEETYNIINEDTWMSRLSPLSRRILGVALALFAGTLYGFNFDPVEYIIDNTPNVSNNSLDYVFSHFCGILLSSIVYAVMYAIFMRNEPAVYPSAILPGFISGLMWGGAQTCWFVANSNLSLSVSFPMIASGPGIIACLWGVGLFAEIRGRRNYIWLLSAMTLNITGIVLTALSK